MVVEGDIVGGLEGTVDVGVLTALYGVGRWRAIVSAGLQLRRSDVEAVLCLSW